MLRGLFDFHIGEHVSEIRFEARAYMRQVARMGIQTLAFMSKDAMGLSYYDTRIGRRNPKLKRDIVRAARAEAKRRGIGFWAYYNVSLDDYLSLEQPDWRQVDAQGGADRVYGWYHPMCLNSPYRDIVRGQLIELARDYAVEGLWLDITYIFPERCYCPFCRRLFRERTGREMPEQPAKGSAALAEVMAFRRWTRLDYLTDLTGAVRAFRGPDFPFTWNHAGCPDFAQVEPDRLSTLSAGEFHAPHYDEGFFKADWMRGFGKPYELMMPECLYGWGEWTVAPLPSMKTMGAIALASGAALNLGHVVVPSGPCGGRVAAPVEEGYARMARWLKPRRAWCESSEAIPVAAILNPVANLRLDSCREGRWLETPPAGVRGAHAMLLDTHWPADLLVEETARNLERYEVILAPDLLHLPEALAEALRAYVRGGGTLIVEGRTGLAEADGTPRADFALADLTGTHLDGVAGLKVRYLDGLAPELARGLPAMPLLVQGATDFPNVRAEADCRILSVFTDPEYQGEGRRHVYHQFGHPAVATTRPAITWREVGKGRALHLVGPVSRSYQLHGQLWLRGLLDNLLAAAVPRPFLRVAAPPSVRVTARRKGSQIQIHLVHWQLEPRMEGLAFAETEWPAAGVRVAVRGPRPARVVQVGDRARERPFRYENGYARVAVAPFKTHAAVVLDTEPRPDETK